MSHGPPEPPEIEADFTRDDGAPVPRGPSVGDKIDQEREVVRGSLAFTLVGLLVAVDIGIFALAAWKVHPFDRDLLALLLTGVLNPIVALVGTMLGFYFGEKAGKAKSDRSGP
jgi:hypothetical protein